MTVTDAQKLVVVTLITDDAGRMLLQKRRDFNIPEADGKWELPGGKVDFGESPEDAARRECREEIGCEVEISGILPTVQSRVWNRTDGARVQAFVICFKGKIVHGEPKPSDRQVTEIGWCERRELEELDLLDGIKEFKNLLV